ncbi:MAG TPA: hypothetical protein EYG03_11245 [Planctomycetes bacterium]|nr:hypothetical protein [Fuerstiella sp.]HIK92540.1 hypothetical protein [Planctomycetota bacterium]
MPLPRGWRIRDKALADYGTVVADNGRLLIIGKGELLLMNADGRPEISSRQRVFPEDLPIYSHPAIIGNRLYIRGESGLRCLGL